MISIPGTRTESVIVLKEIRVADSSDRLVCSGCSNPRRSSDAKFPGISTNEMSTGNTRSIVSTCLCSHRAENLETMTTNSRRFLLVETTALSEAPSDLSGVVPHIRLYATVRADVALDT